MAVGRDSNDADRKLESGTAAVPAEKKDGGLNPALFIACVSRCFSAYSRQTD